MIPEPPTNLNSYRRKRPPRRKAAYKVIKAKSTQQLKKKIRFDSLSCPICFDHICIGEVASTVCGHIFCTDCIERSLRTNKSCPKCRRKLAGSGFHHLFFDLSTDKPEKKDDADEIKVDTGEIADCDP